MICNVSIDKTEAYNKTIKELKCTMKANKGIKVYEKEQISGTRIFISIFIWLYRYVQGLVYLSSCVWQIADKSIYNGFKQITNLDIYK